MRLFAVGFILSQIAVQSEAEKYGSHFPSRGRSHEEDILEPPEPEYRSSQQRDYHSYEDTPPPRKEYDLPVTLKAPPYEEPPYWKDDHHHQQQPPNRRTFFPEDFSPEKPFQGLYRFMSSIFNNGREEHPDTYHQNRAAPPYVTPVTKYVTPFRYVPTEPNYIPPPKPIRASVIKLETVTRSPIYSSFEYETTAKYYPPVKEILDQVLIENSRRARQNVSWYPEESQGNIPPFKPLPVLPKPEYVSPTTLKPNPPRFGYNDQTRNSFEYYNKTDFKFPESVQDQLPDFDVGEVRIPYEAEGPQVFHSPPTEIATTNFEPIDIRSLNAPTNRRERPLRFDFLTTTVKSFPGAVEKVKRPVFKYTKKLTAQLDKGPVERVTNLTVLGFSKPGTEVPTPRTPVDYFKVRDLINYEMGKLDKSFSTKPPENTTTRPVNLNDELSLDARILKDTNWDGLTAAETSTTEIPRETTTVFQDRIVFTDAKPAKTAFWEIGQNTAPGSDVAATTPITTTEQVGYQTTTEFFWPSTTTEETTLLPAILQRRLENLKEETSKSEDVEIVEATIPPPPKRKYSRRPKIVNFTPYPTGEELQRRLATRNHFARRQKPNITLSFGKKDIIKPRQAFGKDEVMKFSDEDVRKRRKIEKRRRVLKRIRVTSSSERSVQDESL